MFSHLGDDYYYLIHKWGNDLSIKNRISGFLKQHGYAVGFFVTMSVVIAVSYSITPIELVGKTTLLKLVSFGVRMVFAFFVSGAVFFGGGIVSKAEKYVKDWNSEYK